MGSIIRVGNKDIKINGSLLKTARLDGEKYEFLEQPEALIEEFRKGGHRADLFTFMQRLPETQPKYGYPMEWDNFAALRVTTFENWWTKQLGYKARNKAKQAEKKGVVVREVPFGEDLIVAIKGVYDESPMRQGARNIHYQKSLESMSAMLSTYLDHSFFIGAYLGETMIGFAKLTYDETRSQAGLMHIISMVKERDKVPNNALIAQAVRSCAERQIPYLVYANFAYGKKQTSSLTEFKERNGFQRIDIPRYYVPLSPAGQLALRLGLHRKLADYLPESWSGKLRELRSAWYQRKFQVAEASEQ